MDTLFNKNVKSMLVLEDDTITKKLWAIVLDKLGLPWEKVDWASSQAHFEARFDEKLAKKGTYDLVVCDIHIPGTKNGVDLWREYRIHKSTFCLVSSITTEKFKAMLKPGEDDDIIFLPKPLDPEKCVEILNTLALAHVVFTKGYS